jgi:hypothetical protein
LGGAMLLNLWRSVMVFSLVMLVFLKIVKIILVVRN